MKRRSVGLFAGILLVALLPGSAMAISPGSILDQWDTTLTANVNSSSDLAQTFTASITGPLTDVQLHLASVSGSLSVAITATSGGSPTGAPLATSDPVTPGSSASWLDFSFASPPAVTAGVTYAIVFNLSSLGGVPSASGSAADTYSGGEALINLGSSWASVNASFSDLAFRTYVKVQTTTLAWDKAQVIAGATTPLTLTETFTFSRFAAPVVVVQPNGGVVGYVVAQVGLPAWFTPTGIVCSSQIAVADCILANVATGLNLTPDGNPVIVTLSGTASPALAAAGTTGTATAEGCAPIVTPDVTPLDQLPGNCVSGSANVAVVAPAATLPPTLPPTTADSSRSANEPDSAIWLLPAGLAGLLGAALLLVNRRRRLIR